MSGLDHAVSKVARKLHDDAAAGRPPATVEVIANKAKVPEAEALAALTVLTAKGLVERVRGGDPLRVTWVYGLTERLRNSLRLKAKQESVRRVDIDHAPDRPSRGKRRW
jgi:hypothetical protein